MPLRTPKIIALLGVAAGAISAVEPAVGGLFGDGAASRPLERTIGADEINAERGIHETTSARVADLVRTVSLIEGGGPPGARRKAAGDFEKLVLEAGDAQLTAAIPRLRRSETDTFARSDTTYAGAVARLEAVFEDQVVASTLAEATRHDATMAGAEYARALGRLAEVDAALFREIIGLSRMLAEAGAVIDARISRHVERAEMANPEGAIVESRVAARLSIAGASALILTLIAFVLIGRAVTAYPPARSAGTPASRCRAIDRPGDPRPAWNDVRAAVP